MGELGFAWTPTMRIGQGCKVHLRDSELPRGKLVVQVSRHFCAVINRVLHDTHDTTRVGMRCVYGYHSVDVSRPVLPGATPRSSACARLPCALCSAIPVFPGVKRAEAYLLSPSIDELRVGVRGSRGVGDDDGQELRPYFGKPCPFIRQNGP
jgi:hypothetical protein